eukprot:TRINITY_DN2208_c0_g2_i1.p1 TRINITY_DN2208_c0_g2~~TRINITY_DN2208_c0_g2_i1.p1  ORF type:complete len:1103 (+),score=343.58 TRINITY_DN2208_c0_g2_i1:123-3431(+)
MFALPPQQDSEALKATVEYLRRIELPEIVEEVVRRVLLSRPESALLAAYELQSAAVDYYNERAQEEQYDDEEEEEESPTQAEQTPAPKSHGDEHKRDARSESFVTTLTGPQHTATSKDDKERKEQERLLCGMRKGNLEGCGASGKVFKAMDKGGTVYAVKQITLPKTDTVVLGDAKQEYGMLKQLTHRNIVRVWDFLANLGKAEIVMSYWTQGSVATQIREFGALPPFTVRKYAVQILRGLGYLHCCRVLHRDIKPQNVLVDATGCVALTDFGLCTVSDLAPKEPAGAAAAPKEMQVFGTWPYLSPGIVRYSKYTEQSDLWAFACSLLEMATAHMPWSGAGNGVPQTWTPFTYCFALLTAGSAGISPIDVREGWEGPPWPPEAMTVTMELSNDLLDFLRMAFSGEQTLLRAWGDEHEEDMLVPVTHRHLMAHPFLGEMRRVVTKSRVPKGAAADGGATLARYFRDVPLSGKAAVYLADDGGEGADQLVDALVLSDSAVAHASPFSGMDVRRKDSGRGYNNTDLSRSYCLRKRPAHVLLSLLGRTRIRDDVEAGLPNVLLSPNLLQRTDDTTEIVIDAEACDRVAREEREQGLSDDNLDRWDPSTDGPAALDVYGPGRFSITVGELKHLTRSTFIHTTSDVPRRFLGDLIALTSRQDQQLFWSAHRAIPLAQVGEPEEEEKLRVVVEDDIRRARSFLNELTVKKDGLLQKKGSGGLSPEDQQELNKIDTEMMRYHHWVSRGQQFMECLLTQSSEGTPGMDHQASAVNLVVAGPHLKRRSLTPQKSFAQGDAGKRKAFLDGFNDFQAWRQHVTLFPFEYGFPSAADGKAALEQSLTELCTAVCVSGLGYLMVDGCDGNHSQLIPRTPQPIAILSAAGLDFNKPLATLREASKYFNRPDDLPPDTPAHLGWKGMLPLAQFRLKERLKELYRCIFECAQHHGARNLSMLPMGLGWFLGNVHADDRATVRKAYFGAQFELLCELDFGFETYYLNAGSPEQRALAEATLEEWLSGTETGNPMSLRCSVVFHCCDAKFLAVELAKRSMAPAILNPADCAATVLGLIGTFWETGRGSHYSGEEDVCAHSTAVLARVGIAEVWGESSRNKK